ncbi:MAG: hypothetical protein DRO43_03795 [Candidatus Hecatellales archaeon]|nr:MAG: hypothetical protein DRO43_03795 [Candidatus Hecatellales archaeon]
MRRIFASWPLKLKLALLLAFIFHLAFAFTGYYERTYDSYTHMFFADHYFRSWFNLWEYKWFGGFTVASYPPLVHQLLALMEGVVGLQNAYNLLNFISLLLLPLAVFRFSKLFLDEDSAGYAAVISVFLPSLMMLTYVGGMITTIFALTVSLFSTIYVERYLSGGSRLNLLTSLALFGVVAGAHHFTGLIFIPMLTVTIAISRMGRATFKRVFFRLLVLLALTAVVYLVVLLPFWDFILHSGGQKEIAHQSRLGLGSMLFRVVFFGNMYTYLIYLLPVVAYFVVEKKSLYPLSALFVFLFVLGLGGTTPLPKLVFGELWKWLTYERFALWAGVVLMPLIGFTMKSITNRIKHRVWSKLPFILFTVIMATSAFQVASTNFVAPGQQPGAMESVEEAANFLNSDDNWKWYYITLGYGSGQQAKLSILTKAPTLDGTYYTARTLPVLRESGIATIDAIKFWQPSLDTLKIFLGKAEQYHLKWVFSADAFYDDVLKAYGFTEKLTFSGGAKLWCKEGVPVASIEEQKPFPPAYSYMWGTLPLLFLTFAILLVLLQGIGVLPRK